MGVYKLETNIERLNNVVKLARETDKLEAYYLCGADSGSPSTALSLATLSAYASSYLSECVYADDGTPLMAYGFIANDLDKPYTVWAICTHHVDDKEYKRLFITESKRIIAEMMKSLPDVTNVVWDENKLAVRWLRFVGAEFDRDSVQYSNKKFLKFKFRGGLTHECLLTIGGD